MSHTSHPFTTKDIALGNDFLRENLHMYLEYPVKNCRVVCTSGVVDSYCAWEVLSAVAFFRNFTADNDPHEEHDFGQVTVGGEKYFFKIDYYDHDWKLGVDPRMVLPYRLLTIMRADEY